MNPVSLTTGAELRELQVDDAETVYALSDAERERLNPWMPWIHHTHGPDDTRGFIEGCRGGDRPYDGIGIWVDGALAGVIGLHVDQMMNSADIGYWIGGAFEGRGLITRACSVMIDIGFGELGLHRITIHAAPANARSRAVPERLGFTQEAVLREAGKAGATYIDLVVYGMLDREWASRPKP